MNLLKTRRKLQLLWEGCYSLFIYILFSSKGSYAGFDETEPTSHQDGKPKVVAYLKNRYQYRYVTMIGDGVTDLEACPPAVRIPFNSIRFNFLLFFILFRMHLSVLVVIKFVNVLKRNRNGLQPAFMIWSKN